MGQTDLNSYNFFIALDKITIEISMDNILTKIMINAEKLPYERQKQLLQIINRWLAERTLVNQNLSEPANTVLSTPAKSEKSEHIIQQHTESPEPQFEMFEPQFAPLASYEPISAREDIVVNVIEDREYERKNVSIPIDFVSSGQLYKEVTKDISAGGMFIKTKKHSRFKKNQQISMVFMLSDNSKPFKLTGKIIRSESEGIAVQFHNISPFESVAIEEELTNTTVK